MQTFIFQNVNLIVCSDKSQIYVFVHTHMCGHDRTVETMQRIVCIERVQKFTMSFLFLYPIWLCDISLHCLHTCSKLKKEKVACKNKTTMCNVYCAFMPNTAAEDEIDSSANLNRQATVKRRLSMKIRKTLWQLWLLN